MQFIHHPDRAVVRVAGELSVDAVEELVDTVDMLCRVYFYSLIEIRIGSRGGTSAALGHYSDALARWRAAGVRGAHPCRHRRGERRGDSLVAR